MTTFAERNLFGVAPDGSEHDVRIRIGVPECKESGAWSAEVSLVPLETSARRIFGVDEWQALQLAQQFAAARVGHFVEGGWKFSWERGGEAITPLGLADNDR